MTELARATAALDSGADRDAFGVRLAELQRLVNQRAPLESRWAALLESQSQRDSR